MFCPKINKQVKSALQQFDSYVDAHVDVALKVSIAIKNLLNSPVADIVTAIIPGELDNTIRVKLVSALDKVVEALTIVDTCKQYTNLNDKLKCFITQLQQRDPQLQDAVLQKLASLLAANLDGQKLKQSLYDLYTQAKYISTKPS